MSNGSNVGNSHPILPLGYPVGNADLRLPLTNLSAIQSRMDYLHLFLSESVHSNTLISKHQMDMVSAEIASAIHQTIINGAALLSLAQLPTPSPPAPPLSSKSKKVKQTAEPPDIESDCDIVELDAVELLAEHIHFCEVCGKGFKRDANLRMHMRAHGNEFKKPEALAKPADKSDTSNRKTRFSCPYDGCNRNRRHKNFRPLKSVMCVKNHFKRSHCPKMHSCNRCNKKSFSVMADLKSHYKHCGETKWKCSCGTTFSRKDKLFGHVALFEGHVPEVGLDEEKNGTEMMDDDDDHVDEGNQHHRNKKMKGLDFGDENDGIFEGLLDGFGSIDENYFWKDVL